MKTLLSSLIAVIVISTPTLASETSGSDWTVRIGAAHVSPNDDSGTVLNGGVSVDSSTGLGVSLAYHLDNNWGIELLAASPFSHDISGTGDLQGLEIGETKQLPPTLSLLYQWGNDTKYHLGLGLNYTKFFEEKSSNQLDTALAANTDLKLDASTGVAVKFGFDTPITNDWNFSGNLYYISIDTTADIIIDNQVAASVDVDIDPWVVMLGVSTSF